MGIPHGDGGRVLLLPGFGGGDHLLAPMALWLRRIGYGVDTCGIWVDTSCSEQAMLRIERRVQELADRHSGRVAIVGHSRGGYLAKALAARRPDQVSHVVTLGSGLSSPLDVAALGRGAVAVVRAVHRVTTDRVAQRGCMTATCACAFTEAYESPFPDDVRLTSIYSKGDGMVRWRSCVVPYADNVEVTGSHVGLAFNRKAYRAIAHALAAWRRCRARRTAALRGRVRLAWRFARRRVGWRASGGCRTCAGSDTPPVRTRP